MTTYDSVLFDSDGILVDPPASETQADATRDAFRSVGATAVEPHHVDAIVEGVTLEELHEICTTYDLEPERFWKARERLDEESQFEKFRDGARALYDDVSAIAALPHTCGVVSNNHHSTIEYVLDAFDLHSLFDTYYGREKTLESLELKKPNTHYLEKALADLEADSALYVGDSESDVIAAHRAGLDSVFVRREHCRSVDLSVTPTYDVSDLLELSEIVDSSDERP
ncbi:HAD family hydrolase [Halostagnicola sp. A-GB9-2]|uniref:HAD family hydrolase n=1 Tax=Halostagnicola sp. A-GB9-2 TaxID=3048066 RepID=UPI0024BFD871|nr:HAD family hydrolase [Halostagnicola sp. A-GB9-2]MDJ1433459.1 HAD family hydrolase [Halostagnicola sp. A-GB9-2]